MSLTPREAFKFGFLARCVEDGLSPAQVVEKAAAVFIHDPFGAAEDAAKSTAKLMMGVGVPLALAAPPVLGGLAGFGLSRATDVNQRDVDEVKNDELTDEYRRQADLLRRTQALRTARKNRRRTGRPLR